jgi:Protein of unknown function (DUF5663)
MQDELTVRIASDLGIDGLPPEEQKEIIGQFGEVALKAATMSILDKLTDATRDEFMKLSEAGDAAALKTFLDREVPEHDTIAKQAVAEEVKRFKDFQKQ